MDSRIAALDWKSSEPNCPSRRLKRVLIDSARLLTALQNSLVSISSDLPDDTKYRGFHKDTMSNTYYFVVESEEFDEVKEGDVIPKFTGDILIKDV